MEDVVCGAASALLQAAWAGLTDVAQVPVSGHRRKGDFLMRWPQDARGREDVHAIVATAELDIEQLAKQYSRTRARNAVTGREIRGTPASKGTPR